MCAFKTRFSDNEIIVIYNLWTCTIKTNEQFKKNIIIPKLLHVDYVYILYILMKMDLFCGAKRKQNMENYLYIHIDE